MGSALVARHPSAWVFQGSETIKFTVVKHKTTVPGTEN
jgi:hypothetical protein